MVVVIFILTVFARCAYGQEVTIPSTPYTRGLMRNTNAANARTYLGLVTSNWAFNASQLEAPGNQLQIKSGASVSNLNAVGLVATTVSGTSNSLQTTRWDTNAFRLYYGGNTDIANGSAGTLWQNSFNPDGVYTNGLIAYSNLYWAPSNAWEIFSNGQFVYQGAPNVSGIYGDQIASFNYAKAKGHLGPLPAPKGFIAAGNTYSNAFNAPPLWNTQTNAKNTLVQLVCSIGAPGGQFDYWINLGSNNVIQFDTNMPGFGPLAIIGGFNNTNAGPYAVIVASHDCYLGDAQGFIGASSGSTLFRGSGDDFMLGAENCVQQNFANSVVGTLASFGCTNYADSTSILMASEFGLMDGGCGNFTRISGTTFYDNVNTGFASGSYQTNGLPLVGGVSSIWDVGNGNTVTLPNRIFLGFTNLGLTVTPTNTTMDTGGIFTDGANNLTVHSLTQTSDATLKENFRFLDPLAADMLRRVVAMPVSRWNFKGEKREHIGPMAQDFYAQFGLGDGRGISVLDQEGVTLLAVKGLYERTQLQIRIIWALLGLVAALSAMAGHHHYHIRRLRGANKKRT